MMDEEMKKNECHFMFSPGFLILILENIHLNQQQECEFRSTICTSINYKAKILSSFFKVHFWTAACHVKRAVALYHNY